MERDMPTGGVRWLIVLLIALGLFFVAAAGMVRFTAGWSAWLTESVMSAGVCFGVAGLLKLQMVRVAQGREQTAILVQLSKTLEASAAKVHPAAAPVSTAPVAMAVPSANGTLTEEKFAEGSRSQVLELLQQIRDAAMMSESQREQCATAHWEKRKGAISKLVDRHMLSGDWTMARSRLEELRALLPADPDVQSLSDRLSSEHSSRMMEDLTAARAQLRHLASITAWQEMEDIVLSLQRKYPQETQVLHLSADIAHEREKIERHHRERLLSTLAEATERREWRRAIDSAEEFIQRFPEDGVAERLRFDLGTLRDNASAADRKEQEQLFKELLRGQRYEEAEGIARGLIEKYPNSAVAAELLKMLPRVEELHRQEKLKRQGVGAG